MAGEPSCCGYCRWWRRKDRTCVNPDSPWYGTVRDWVGITCAYGQERPRKRKNKPTQRALFSLSERRWHNAD